jgi:hypothetical protein
MSRMFDRIMAHGTRISMFDLSDSFRFSVDPAYSELAKQIASSLQAPWVADFQRSVRPEGTGVVKEVWQDAKVFAVDNVHRYLAENKVTTQDLMDMLENISIVPAYEWMAVESRCPGHGMGAASFAWLVHREENIAPGQRWQMTAHLNVEWVKDRPIGPIGIMHLFMDEQGKFIPKAGKTEPIELFQAPVDPYHPGLLEELCEPMFFGMVDMYASLLMALGLVHCKNVLVEEHSPDTKPSKNHERRHGRPLTRYSTIDIKPITRALDGAKQPGQGTLGKAFHLCRGHFKTFRPEAPLFGKLSGQYWWDAHARGNKRHGEVISEYRVHGPHDEDLIGLAYETSDVSASSADPDLLERGRIAHEHTQGLLAEAILGAGLTPLRPAPHEPQYDLAWQIEDMLWVAEVKSTTSSNEARQVRAAIGQVLHYCEQLRSDGRVVHPVIALENELRATELADTCARAGITVVWAPSFSGIPALATAHRDS